MKQMILWFWNVGVLNRELMFTMMILAAIQAAILTALTISTGSDDMIAVCSREDCALHRVVFHGFISFFGWVWIPVGAVFGARICYDSHASGSHGVTYATLFAAISVTVAACVVAYGVSLSLQQAPVLAIREMVFVGVVWKVAGLCTVLCFFVLCVLKDALSGGLTNDDRLVPFVSFDDFKVANGSSERKTS
ncbi:hypothetical protein [Ruegeria sp. HKCCD8929]|uniref:hypothetical protein n=1 Tax=Ruegeria sp. HKCCD8929 TaxID=2683006 RepID=UPI0014877DCD|nr:hypothetical protein [Ruegeria sp. HKCCD8929]